MDMWRGKVFTHYRISSLTVNTFSHSEGYTVNRQRITQPYPQSEHEHEQMEHDEQYIPLAHDAFHCRFCSTDKKILQATVILNSTMQTLLTKFQEAEGTPHGTPFNFSQAAPTQNAVYTSPIAPMGVARSIVIGGNGNVTLTMKEPNNSVAGGLVIATLPCNGGSVAVPHRFVVPNNAKFTVSTDSAAGTGIVSLSLWIEPVVAGNAEYFQLRK